MAMKLTGHKTEEIYRRYAIVSEADLREGVRKSAAARLRHNPRHNDHHSRPHKVGWMTGFEPATPGATVRSEPREEVATSRVVLTDGDLRDPEEGSSDINGI